MLSRSLELAGLIYVFKCQSLTVEQLLSIYCVINVLRRGEVATKINVTGFAFRDLSAGDKM